MEGEVVTEFLISNLVTVTLILILNMFKQFMVHPIKLPRSVVRELITELAILRAP